MKKKPYYLNTVNMDQPPYSQIWVYTDDEALVEVAQTFEAARVVFRERDVVKIYLNPQYSDEEEVLNELIDALDACTLSDVWRKAIDDLDE